jgi:hypothetical protein
MGDQTILFLRLLAALDEGRHRQAALLIKHHAHMVNEAAAYEASRSDDRQKAAELPAQFKPAS